MATETITDDNVAAAAVLAAGKMAAHATTVEVEGFAAAAAMAVVVVLAVAAAVASVDAARVATVEVNAESVTGKVAEEGKVTAPTT